MFTHCGRLYQYGGWLVVILRYVLHCQSFEQLSPIHRQLAWCAVWHGVQCGLMCSAAWCAVRHGVHCGMVYSVAWCAVWHGVQCGMVCSVAWCTMWHGVQCGSQSNCFVYTATPTTGMTTSPQKFSRRSKNASKMPTLIYLARKFTITKMSTF